MYVFDFLANNGARDPRTQSLVLEGASLTQALGLPAMPLHSGPPDQGGVGRAVRAAAHAGPPLIFFCFNMLVL